MLHEEKDLDVAILQTQMDATRFKRIKNHSDRGVLAHS